MKDAWLCCTGTLQRHAVLATQFLLLFLGFSGAGSSFLVRISFMYRFSFSPETKSSEDAPSKSTLKVC